MPSRRTLKAAEAIREVVSMAILTELKDPRIQHVTVTSVEVTPDMRQATVRVSIMGDDTKQRLALHGLRSAAGFLQSKVANRIDTRYTPRLQFEIDQGVKKSIEIAEILRRVLPNESAARPENVPDHPAADESPDDDVPDTELDELDGAEDHTEADEDE